MNKEFMKFVKDVNGCWEWQGYKNKDGYGKYKSQLAHRCAYKETYGDIKYSINHICRNRCCVNPEHLEDIPLRENILKGDTLAAKNIKKTHCINGHEYNNENTRIVKNKRYCRICNLMAVRKYQESL